MSDPFPLGPPPDLDPAEPSRPEPTNVLDTPEIQALRCHFLQLQYAYFFGGPHGSAEEFHLLFDIHDAAWQLHAAQRGAAEAAGVPWSVFDFPQLGLGLGDGLRTGRTASLAGLPWVPLDSRCPWFCRAFRKLRGPRSSRAARTTRHPR